MFTDDPIRDFEQHDAEQERWLSKRPVCAVCGEHVQDDLALFLWNEWICDECVAKNKAWVDDYIADEPIVDDYAYEKEE